VSNGSDYGFARRPWWIAGHVLALTGIVVFVLLGLWQIRRHDERREFNELLTSRLEAPAQSLEDLVTQYGEEGDLLDLRRVEVTGTYAVADEVILRNRTQSGRSGHDVLTPLETAGGRAIIVNRGWVPIDVNGPPVVGAEPPGGEVVVSGIVRATQERGSFGPVDPATGRLDRISRIDVARLQQQTPQDLYPFAIQLDQQNPGQAQEFPIPQPVPSPESGPHLSYAVQWIVFALVVAVGYPLLMWRTARRTPGAGKASTR
jgi:cytochrome oxidase assembly protein ShyY1